MTINIAAGLEAAVSAVAAACKVAKTVQLDLQRVQHMTKNDRSPVTVADFAVQAIIAQRLREMDPEALLVGEEHAGALRGIDAAAIRAAVCDAVRCGRDDLDENTILDAIDIGNYDASDGTFWTLDPIDGTKGFLRGQQYAIALALIEEGEVTLGLMGCPNLSTDRGASLDSIDEEGVVFLAQRGRGCVELPLRDALRGETSGRAVRSGRVDANASVRMCESVESAHSDQSASQQILEAMGVVSTPVRVDSQVKYALVARGQADIYLRLPTRGDYRERIWDHAAGMIIATEAAAVVSDVEGNALNFNCGQRLEQNRGIVCATPDLHAGVIAAIRKLGVA